MKVGIKLVDEESGPPGTLDALVEVARRVDELGFDSLWLADHVVVPAGFASDYPYQQGQPDWRSTVFPEPLIALAYLAGVTERVELRTGILILPERNPVLTAKQLATLDALSGGRLAVGVGLGWMREEYAALGVPWERRGRRCDEYIDAMRRLWTEDEASYDGETVSFERVRCMPRPVRPGGVPLIVGGHSEAAARRAGRRGDGFLPAGAFRDDHPHLISTMRAAAEAAGRDPDALELCTKAGEDDLGELARLGFGHVYLNVPFARPDAAGERLERLAALVGERAA